MILIKPKNSLSKMLIYQFQS